MTIGYYRHESKVPLLWWVNRALMPDARHDVHHFSIRVALAFVRFAKLKKFFLSHFVFLIAMTIGSASFAFAQEKNPNKLPLCIKTAAHKPRSIQRKIVRTNCWGKQLVKNSPLFRDGLYEGEFVDGMFQGFGFFYFKSDEHHSSDYYVGFFQDGKMTDQGVFYFSSGERYIGSFLGSKRSGFGTFLMKNGNRYEGEWRDDQFNGKGRLTFPYGEIYEGHFVQGLRTGNGEIKFSDGSIFTGDFLNDKRHGQGIELRSDGSRFEGEWIIGKREGLFIITRQGHSFETIFVNDREKQ